MNWISVKDHLPTKDGDYLVTIDGFDMYRYIKSVSWTNDLNKLNEWEFPAEEYKGVGGFYDYDGEFGDYEVSYVLAWCKIEPYEGE